jgi:DtxR family Mn-dependent transcriptional regulator
MIHPPADEVLERLWYLKEEQRTGSTPEALRLDVSEAELHQVLDELARSGAVQIDGEIALLPEGEARARGIVRRHRLAEILFTQVFETDPSEAELSACEFEHILSEAVVDRVCAFLGHPPKCPHGKPIPQGTCCRKFERTIEPLIRRLADIPVGATGTIVYIVPRAASRLGRLASLGIIPGTPVRLVQRKPAFVMAVAETTVALEEEIAYEIYVRS